MPYLTNYHVREQEAYALLGPVHAALRDLEARTAHYASRLAMEADQREAVQAAGRAVAAARAEVERIWRASMPAPEGGASAGTGSGAGAEARA